MLKLAEVWAGYGRTPVLQGIDLEIAAGQRAAVLGRNGVGKTTMMRAIIGQIGLLRGQLSFDGDDIGRRPAHERARRGIAYVPQGRQIFTNLSVRDNLRAAAYGTRQRDIGERLDEVLAELPVLGRRLHDSGGGLSGGQQQILALGRALMTAPSVLLLDEPSEGIQPSIVDEIAEIVRKLNERRGITVVVVEQNLEFVARVASDAHLMDKGRIVRRMPAEQVLEDREVQHEYLGV